MAVGGRSAAANTRTSSAPSNFFDELVDAVAEGRRSRSGGAAVVARYGIEHDFTSTPGLVRAIRSPFG
jgi:hypothetical protein